jgi:hypothetical protein
MAATVSWPLYKTPVRALSEPGGRSTPQLAIAYRPGPPPCRLVSTILTAATCRDAPGT